MFKKAIWIAFVLLNVQSSNIFSQSLYSNDLQASLQDSDKDGVINARDVCENTKLGTKVENNGCPIIYLEFFHFNFDVQFDSNKHQLKSQFHTRLESLARFLQDYPETIVIIEGHTDNLGSKKHNLILSKQRAESIANALVASFNIQQNRIKPLGFGPENPLESNETEEGRRKNRRVTGEIIQPLLPPQTKQNLANYNTFSIPYAVNQYSNQTSHQLIINKLGTFLQENPDSLILIEGHTDNTGNRNLNLALSERRANEIAKTIEAHFSISKERLKVIGYGEQKPIDVNNTPESRQKNRRVDITIGDRFKAKKEMLLPKWTIWDVDDNTSTKPEY
jgi:OOP family OmpA-OmpF porin